MKNALIHNSRRTNEAVIHPEKVILAAATVLMFAAAWCLFPAAAGAQTVTVGTVSGLPGTCVELPINFNAGAQTVMSVELDLGIPSALTPVPSCTGTASMSSERSVQIAMISGGLRIVIFGMNHNPLLTGQIAIIPLFIAAGTPPGILPVSVNNILALDPLGGSVSTGGVDGRVIVTAPPDHTPPILYLITVSGITKTSAIISWNTNELADTQVEYGLTAGYGSSTVLDTTPATSHAQTLSGLTENTLYHFRVMSTDGSGNLAVSGDNAFTTSSDAPPPPPPPPDPPGPEGISGVMALNITATSATIVWMTSAAADSQVEYGINYSYGTSSTLDTNSVTIHSVEITGLTPVTQYHYRVSSRDGYGNLARSGDYFFLTSRGGDGTPPVITGVTCMNITNSSATISWTTNRAADSQVEYGTSRSYGILRPLNGILTTTHAQDLSGLAANTLYHFRVMSRDADGNLAVSGDYTFTTADVTGSTLFYPHMFTKEVVESGSPDQEFTGFGIANLNSRTATLRFSAYNAGGTLVTGPGITNPVTRDLGAWQQLPLMDHELFGAGLTRPEAGGWVKIDTSFSKVTGFFMMFNGWLSELDGADMYNVPVTSFVFPAVNNDGFTKISIANPNSDTVTLILNLMGNNGSIQATATREIPGNGALVADLFSDIFTASTPNAEQYVKVATSKVVYPYQLMGKFGLPGTPAQDFQSLHGQDANVGVTRLYSPQYVIGGMWRTSLSVVNLDSVPGDVTFRLIGDDGVQIGATRTVAVEAYGKIHIEDPTFFESPLPEGGRQGYLEIASSTLRMTGSVVFGDVNRKTLTTALPLTMSLDQSIVFSHVSSNDQYYTGVAIVNPNLTEAHVTVEFYNQDGSLGVSTPITIPARRRTSQLLTQIFTTLAGQQLYSGYFKVTSDIGVTSYSVFGTRDLTLLSAIPPQIVR